jgi:hypothetical protein
VQDNLADMLRTARAAVDEAGLPDDLRPWGFFAAALSQSGSGVLRPSASEAAGSPRAASGLNGSAAEDALAELAERLGVERKLVEEAYYTDEEGRPQLGLARGRLGRRTARAARQVALLSCVARQYDGQEQFTPAAAIRATCQDYGVFDSGNFAKTLVSMADVFQFQGSGQTRRARVVRPGYDEAGAILRGLVQ